MFLNVHTHFTTKSKFEILNSGKTFTGTRYFSIGIHPRQSHDFLQKILDVETAAQHTNCVAIGECGLDKIIDIPLSEQMACFEKQIEISEKLELPLILHCVKAWNEVSQIRKKWNPKQTWIFHGFRKTSLLESVLAEKMMVGIGTAVLFDKKLQAVIVKIPDERLLLETDDDTEHNIEDVYAKVAELKGISLTKLEEIIEQNFRRLFLKFNFLKESD